MNHEVEHLLDTLEHFCGLDPWSNYASSRYGWHDSNVNACTQHSVGHGDYGIVSEPCKLHMPEGIINRLMVEGNATITSADVKEFRKAYNKFLERRGYKL